MTTYKPTYALLEIAPAKRIEAADMLESDNVWLISTSLLNRIQMALIDVSHELNTADVAKLLRGYEVVK